MFEWTLGRGRWVGGLRGRGWRGYKMEELTQRVQIRKGKSTTPVIINRDNFHSSMGSCLTQQHREPRDTLDRKTVVNAPATMNFSETHLLKLMFEDLIARSGSNVLTRDDFDVFFHLNGMWGQEIFKSFQPNQRGQLAFEDFKVGIEKLVKGSIQQRVLALFGFYDTEKTNSICYFDLITMMFSYPKDELKKILDDEKFVATLDSNEKQYHFGKTSPVDEKQVVEEVYSDHSTSSHASKHNSVASYQSKKSIQSTGERKSSKLSFHRKCSGSISYFDSLSKRNIKIASNISMMVKKFVNFLFDELNLEKETDALSEQQFVHMVSKHQQIFNSYFEGFHNYIWETYPDGTPISKQMSPWISSHMLSYDPETGTTQKVYMKYIRSTLFVYKHEHDSLPSQIINLEGLQLEEFEHEGKEGFLLKHSYGYYQEKHYLFKDKTLGLEWLHHLNHLKSTSIHENYRLLEKIGTGNFSNVYRGVEKKTRNEVAIKVIEKFKLSSGENYIIRHECEVLELCHHPCIVKYKEKIESKTHIYIVTELLNDGDLYDYIYHRKFIGESEASFILKELIQTVQYMDALGLIHRDIKPENIIIRKRGDGAVERVKLIDFGFAVFKNSLDTMKKCEKFAGTPGYSAPEILRLEEYDGSVDNFSLGVLLYFMLSGGLPFDSSNNEEIKKLTLIGEVKMEGPRWDSISENAKDLIRRLLMPSECRISLEEALSHPWISGNCDNEEMKSAAGVSKTPIYTN